MNDVISGLEGDLRSNGISVESIDPNGETVDLAYLTAFPDVSVNHQEMGRALRTFIDAAEHGEWEPKRVEATVLRHEDDVQGSWHAEADWFRQYLDYDSSGEEFSARVIGTLSEGRP
ncbi:hypothetical protein [Halobellus captivus]|uniref:hypothetical protein n=1 Tax=Halobellus captivus TaxID=2592614 RepID=UPI0011A27976|nr:hypothetical protein [Halobellus captivus]